MKFSCNGCRVLRKGCNENCSIRPCLEWIKSHEAQANATLFLAKFYGRTGLLNLVVVGPHHLRPSIFKSLLQEACGRIVNPIYGCTSLISTENRHLCKAAVEAVLSGLPIAQISIESAVQNASPLFKVCDIRHVSKKDKELHKVKNQNGFKRSKSKLMVVQQPEPQSINGGSSSQNNCGVSESCGSDSGSVQTVKDTVAKPMNEVINAGYDLNMGFQGAQHLVFVKCLELKLGLPGY